MRATCPTRRSGTQTILPGTVGTAVDDPVGDGTTCTYRLRAFYEVWTSATLQRDATVTC